MKEEATPNFGLVIAYLIPGAVALYGVGYFIPAVRIWFGSTPETAPSLGGFLFLTIASITAGITVSTVRWGLLDAVHHLTGIRPPEFDFGSLGTNVAGYDYLIEIHYRYYQFYANMIVALTFTYFVRRWALGESWRDWGGWDVCFVLLTVLFWAGSRDALHKYYRRAEQLLKPQRKRQKRAKSGERT